MTPPYDVLERIIDLLETDFHHPDAAHRTTRAVLVDVAAEVRALRASVEKFEREREPFGVLMDRMLEKGLASGVDLAGVVAAGRELARSLGFEPRPEVEVEVADINAKPIRMRVAGHLCEMTAYTADITYGEPDLSVNIPGMRYATVEVRLSGHVLPRGSRPLPLSTESRNRPPPTGVPGPGRKRSQ